MFVFPLLLSNVDKADSVQPQINGALLIRSTEKISFNQTKWEESKTVDEREQKKSVGNYEFLCVALSWCLCSHQLTAAIRFSGEVKVVGVYRYLSSFIYIVCVR